MHDLSTRRDWSAAEIDSERAAYDGSIAWLDSELGKLFEALGARGRLDNTIVVVTSDHGEQFGEHGLMDHGNSLYRPLLEVPLVIVWPGRVPAGVRVDTPVSLRDLPATITDLVFGQPTLPGRSLAGLWDDSSMIPSPLLSELQEGIRSPEWLPVARGDLESLVVDDHHYIRNGDGREELYDLSADPEERRDLVGSEAAGPRLAILRARLEALLGPAGVAVRGHGLGRPTPPTWAAWWRIEPQRDVHGLLAGLPEQPLGLPLPPRVGKRHRQLARVLARQHPPDELQRPPGPEQVTEAVEERHSGDVEDR